MTASTRIIARGKLINYKCHSIYACLRIIIKSARINLRDIKSIRCKAFGILAFMRCSRRFRSRVKAYVLRRQILSYYRRANQLYDTFPLQVKIPVIFPERARDAFPRCAF